MDKIIIRDLTARGIIGVYEWERKEPQEILINVMLKVDLSQAAQNDDVTQSVDYHEVATRLREHAETAKRHSVEALAEDLTKICLEYPKVNEVTVQVEKPGAVRFTRSVGVEITRKNQK
jgi:FolB domain-containing protein